MAADTKILRVKGRAVPVPGDDIDTDRIMPARYLRCVTFENIGQYTFQDERFTPEGKTKDHPFNDPRHKGASILAVNKNFGCGSSREHAPQGILRWGIKAVVGESFAEIFAGNCVSIGLPAVTASAADVKRLMDFARANPDAEADLDLQKKTVSFGGVSIPVDIKESARQSFLEGTWDSSATLLAGMDSVRETARKVPYLDWLHS
ncbi:MAG: 3-isopropylmalate dehydratase small subunit [Elusimicrobiota bacterium]|jgi:3-isopropylmalate/(R)-2-methylmalate dehydratase small subunit